VNISPREGFPLLTFHFLLTALLIEDIDHRALGFTLGDSHECYACYLSSSRSDSHPMPSWKQIFSKAFLVKPVAVAIAEGEDENSKLERTLSLFDLLCIGVGGTVGSGIFVLTGLIAHEYAGPGVILSWLLAGVACSTSALSYAELSCLIPAAGSSYAYVYLGLGELPAFITAWCLTLEYGVSGAAVASSWGVKLQNLIAIWGSPSHPSDSSYHGYSINGTHINIYGGVLQFLVMLLLLRGIHVSKTIINFFTVLKLALVLFIICAGFVLFRPTNIQHWTPYGFQGVFRGAASCFFGYLGYDEVCCLAGEAKSPQQNLPRAVIGTILIITSIYIIGAIVLVGMQPYTLIDVDSGYSMAFYWNGWIWAQQIVAIGEIITLPLVVLVSFLAQPRLQYALAVDGLIPSLFQEVDRNGSLVKGILVSGIACTIVTVFVPFFYLDDMISAGVLVSFNLTNTSLIILRCKHQSNGFNRTLHMSASATSVGTEDDPMTSTANSAPSSDTDGIELLPHAFTSSDAKIFPANDLAMRSLLIHLAMFHLLTIVMCSLIASIDYSQSSADIARIVFIFMIAAVLVAQSISMHFILFPSSTAIADALKSIHRVFSLSSFHYHPTMLVSTHSMHITPSMDAPLQAADNTHTMSDESCSLFQVPCMPYIPLIGLVINYYLMVQLSWFGLMTIALVLVLSVFVYFTYSMHHSRGNLSGWNHHHAYDHPAGSGEKRSDDELCDSVS
jgi:amino acid transporter